MHRHTISVQSNHDIVVLRTTVMNDAREVGMSPLDRTKLVTAVSELARNTLVHGGGGTVLVDLVMADDRRGMRLSFVDQGKGIPDVDAAMRDGFTTGKSLGLGLPGARKLVDEFDLHSVPGAGTTVAIVKWTR